MKFSLPMVKRFITAHHCYFHKDFWEGLAFAHLHLIQQIDPDWLGFSISHLQLSHLMSRPSGVRLH